jgi:peptidoglycan/xylan/chitin deacetylase (PgdA/CDA1 family)
MVRFAFAITVACSLMSGCSQTAGTGNTPAVDGGAEVGAEGAAEGGACTPTTADAGLVDGMMLGLPVIDVPTAPPLATRQVAAASPDDHYPKQVGVLNLSPSITDAQSVVHILAPMGIPYAITSSPVLAIQHDMVLFFPEASTASFDATAVQLLDDYLRGGGLVAMKYSEVDALKQRGGVASSTFKLPHHSVNLTDAGKARFPSLDQPVEQSIPLGGDGTEFLNTWAIAVDPAAQGVRVLATFDDGTAAIVEHDVGAGHVITIGVDWRDVILRNQLGHAIGAARGYINLFEPATDAWMLMVRDLYDTTVRFGVRLHSAPGAARSALLVSHDLDWGKSYENALQYADDEKARGATATYFVHTKYVTDYQDIAFFGPEREGELAQLLASGGRIASHTVAHSPLLDSFPVGDGNESYPTYAPFNVSASQTTGGTLFGELRVSKSLIDGALAARCVEHASVTFRAGNLAYNAAAPQTMERLGYRFDSTRAVGDVLSNFPYRAMTDWPDSLDTSVFEFPVTLEDQLPPRLDQRVADALAIVGFNADNGAPTTLLIHPNILDFKENAERAILDGLPGGVHAMSVDEFAEFWRVRDAVRLTNINYDDQKKTLTVAVSAPEAIDALTLRVDRSVVSVVDPASAILVQGQRENLVTLPRLAAGATQVLTLGYM